MTSGSIWKELLAFSIPMAIGLLFQQLYNTVDAVVVGKYVGKEALAAVGSTGNIINMMVGLCAGLSVGASVVISQHYGAHDDAKLKDAVHTTLAVTLILCAAATLAGVLLVDPLLHMMDTPADVMPEAHEYLTIFFYGLSGLLIYNMGSGILRAVGDSRRPLYFLCFSAVTNIVFDVVLVVNFNMGIAGAACATIFSEILSAVLVLFVLTRTDAAYGVRWNCLVINRATLKHILSIGFPSGLQQALTSFSNVFVQAYINAFGSACMAGWASYNKVDMFILIPAQSIAMTSTTFVGQNYGAGKLVRARKGVRQSLIMSLVITAALSVTMEFTARPLAMLFSDEEDVIAYSVLFLQLISPFYVLICFNQIFSGALRGIGVARTPVIIMLFSFVLFRQAYLYVNKLLGGYFLPVAVAYPVGWAMCSLLMSIYYRRSILCHPESAVGISRAEDDF